GAVPLPASLASFFGGGATGGVAVGGLGIGMKVATVLAAGLVVTSIGHEPIKARARAERAPAAKDAAAQRETAFAPATSRSAGQISSGRRRHTRRTTRTRKLGPTKPAPVAVGSGGSPEAPTSPGGGDPLPTPTPRVTVQQPPIRVPELPVQPPPLRLPIQLPPPPIQLPPPVQLPPPPPLP